MDRFKPSPGVKRNLWAKLFKRREGDNSGRDELSNYVKEDVYVYITKGSIQRKLNDYEYMKLELN